MEVRSTPHHDAHRNLVTRPTREYDRACRRLPPCLPISAHLGGEASYRGLSSYRPFGEWARGQDPELDLGRSSLLPWAYPNAQL